MVGRQVSAALRRILVRFTSAVANLCLTRVAPRHLMTGITGNFEVKVDGELMHSKKTKEEGFLHTNGANMEKISCAIKSKLE